jgi:hypothetical protein
MNTQILAQFARPPLIRNQQVPSSSLGVGSKAVNNLQAAER